MKKELLYRMLLLLFFTLLQKINHAEVVQLNEVINFYSKKISIKYDFPFNQKVSQKILINDKNVENYLNQFKVTPNQLLVQRLLFYKDSLHLNDWFFFQLLCEATKSILIRYDNNIQTIFLFHLLEAAGYNAKLGYGKKIQVYVYTKEDTYNLSEIKAESKTYVHLPYPYKLDVNNSKTPLPLIGLKGSNNGKAFSFAMNSFPDIMGGDSLINKSIHFFYKDSLYEFIYNVSANYIDMLTNYPGVNEEMYFTIPTSVALDTSLLPKLMHVPNMRDTEDMVYFLLAFTRLGLKYKEDIFAYGVQKYMSAEETLFFEYSDCKGRATLFSYLVNRLLGIKQIVLFYKNHVSIALNLNRSMALNKTPIKFNGLDYYICDPVGPGNSLRIGDHNNRAIGPPIKIEQIY